MIRGGLRSSLQRRLNIRTAMLIGLIVLGAAGAASAQSGYLGGYKPYQPPKPYSADRDPYDLPKAYNSNPYARDFSTNRDSNAYVNTRRDRLDDGYSPGGYSAGGSSSRGSSNGGYLGYRPAPPPSYGSSRSSTGSERDLSRCRIGIVC